MGEHVPNSTNGASFENRFYGYLYSQISTDLSIIRDYRVKEKVNGLLTADFAVIERTTDEPIAVFECQSIPKDRVKSKHAQFLAQLDAVDQSAIPRSAYFVAEGNTGMFSFWLYDQKEHALVDIGDDIFLDLQGAAAITRKKEADKQWLICSILSWIYAAVCLALFMASLVTCFEPSTNSLILLGFCGICTMAPFLQTLRFRNSFLELEFPRRSNEGK